MRSRRWTAPALVALLGAIAVATGGSAAGVAETRGGAARPNVLVVMTDDQRADDTKVMREVKRRLARRGATFRNAFATFPLCCPSRATYLTGQYAHNHNVLGNVPPHGSVTALDDTETISVALDDAGYRTGWIGKYLNRYAQLGSQRPPVIPPGYDVWKTLISAFRVYQWNQLVGGKKVRWGKKPRDYQTDVFARQASSFIRSSSKGDAPFFLTVAPGVPHSETASPKIRFNPRPARRHERALERLRFPKTEAFNERDLSDKPALIRAFPRLSRSEVRRTKKRRLARLESLLAVDDLVASLVQALKRRGELSNTLIVFTSDNGYQLGEHRLGSKDYVYEESIRVPLIVRGPGVPAGAKVRSPAANLDVPATIHDLTEVAPLLTPDGISLYELIADPAAFADRSLLIQTTRRQLALRTPRYLYAESDSDPSRAGTDDEVELYDLASDPHQVESIHDEPNGIALIPGLAGRLDQLRDCAGAGCR